MWTSRNFPPKTRTTAAVVVHSLSIPLFLSQFLPHSGSSLSPHKTVHSLQLLTGFHLSLSYPACPIALSKLRLHGHIFSSLRSHPLPLCKAYIRNPLLYLLMNAVASRSVSGSFQLSLTEASPLTRRLVLCALEAGECLSAFKIPQYTGKCHLIPGL